LNGITVLAVVPIIVVGSLIHFLFCEITVDTPKGLFIERHLGYDFFDEKLIVIISLVCLDTVDEFGACHKRTNSILTHFSLLE
jgi:hypothetical protein